MRIKVDSRYQGNLISGQDFKRTELSVSQIRRAVQEEPIPLRHDASRGVEMMDHARLALAGIGLLDVRRDFARHRDRRFLQVMVALVHHGHREVKRSLDHRHLGKPGY